MLSTLQLMFVLGPLEIFFVSPFKVQRGNGKKEKTHFV